MMATLVKLPYEGGLADAEQIELKMPPATTGTVTLPDGNELAIEMAVKDVFQLVDKKDEKGEPIFILTVQVKSSFVKKDQASEVG